jgi:hypothetical protein
MHTLEKEQNKTAAVNYFPLIIWCQSKILRGWQSASRDRAPA